MERRRIPVDSRILGMRTISAMAITSYANIGCKAYNPSRRIQQGLIALCRRLWDDCAWPSKLPGILWRGAMSHCMIAPASRLTLLAFAYRCTASQAFQSLAVPDHSGLHSHTHKYQALIV